MIFLLHGHQGTMASDRLAWLSRIFVRYVWRPIQRELNVSLDTPARSYDMREKHDKAMYGWARDHRQRPVLITGHTHRPGDAIARAPAELELIRTAPTVGEATGAPRRPACYFNTGCCSFGNGDITAIEIADGDIRLVRWLGEDEEPKPKALADDKLGHILAAVRGIKVATA